MLQLSVPPAWNADPGLFQRLVGDASPQSGRWCTGGTPSAAPGQVTASTKDMATNDTV